MTQNFSDLIAQQLNHYGSLKVLQENNAKAVFYARHCLTQDEVAIKILMLNSIFNENNAKEERERFKREVSIIIGFSHADIISMREYKEHEDFICFVMPFYKDGTLRDLIKKQGRMLLEETIQLISQIAPALDYAHAKNIIHRDIKPDNFLLAPNGRLILSDFGIARRHENTNGLPLPYTFCGTAGFTSPEVLQGRKADKQADIYALGMVIYEMLHGAPPFSGENFTVISKKQLEEPLPLLHEQHFSIPQAIDDVLSKATAKEPEHRYDSASELATALVQAATHTTFWNSPTKTTFSPLADPAHSNFLPEKTTLSKRASFFTIACIGLGLIVLLLIGNFVLTHGLASIPLQTSQLTPENSMIQQARATVSTYYQDWNNGDYQAAYDLLSPEYHKKSSYEKELTSYKKPLYVCFTIDSISIDNEGIEVHVTANELQRNNTDAVSETDQYVLFFTVQKVQGRWLLMPHILSGPSTYGTCNP